MALRKFSIPQNNSENTKHEKSSLSEKYLRQKKQS